MNGMDPHWPWAAFVRGYDQRRLRGWVEGLWRRLDNIEEGEFPVPKELPIEFAELVTACNAIATVPGVDGGTIARLVAAAIRLESTCRNILFQLRLDIDDPQLVDLSAPAPPVDEELIEIEKNSQALLQSVPKLEPWRKLGVLVAELVPDWQVIRLNPPDSNFARLVAYCRELNSENGIQFLEDLMALADRVKRHGALSQLWNRIKCEGEPDRINPGWLATYLKMQLWDQAPFSPYFELSADRLRIFGQEIGTGSFGKSITSLLWVICENPMIPLRRSYIIEQMNIRIRPENLKTYVSRLRKKLRPPMKEYLRSTNGKGKHPADCFINTLHSGYCGLTTMRVNINGPRPDWMSPKRPPRSDETKY